MLTQYELFIDIYGIGCRISVSSRELYERLENDFKYFVVPGNGHELFMNIICYIQVPPFEKVEGKRRFRFREVITHDQGLTRYNNYDENLLSIYNFTTEEGSIYSQDINLLHEITYLLILSRVGKALDLKGLHRLHAMAVTNGRDSFVSCGASGTGKTTGSLSFIKNGYSLISDDTPLVDRHGRVYPFPIRIGLQNQDMGKNYIVLKRREYGEKYLYDAVPFASTEKISSYSLICLEKRNKKVSRIKESTFLTRFVFLLKYMVIGLGTPQIIEYFWEPGVKDFFIKMRIFLSRCICLIRLLKNKNSYQVSLKDGDSLYDVLSTQNN